MTIPSFDIPFVLRTAAKINFRLRVVGRSVETGYHDLRMLNATVAFGDCLRITLRENPTILLRCLDEEGAECANLNNPENLVCRAITEFQKRSSFPFGAEVELVKRIPLESGLGGGSGDGAVVLLFLSRVFQKLLKKETRTPPTNLDSLALNLGADVPYLLHGGFALVGGVGEEIHPIASVKSESKRCKACSNYRCDCLVDPSQSEPLKEVLLLFPESGMSTARVFEVLRSGSEYSSTLKHQEDTLLSEWQHSSHPLSSEVLSGMIQNDLLPIAKELSNDLKNCMELFSELDGMQFGMSGSGSTCFLFPVHRRKFSPKQLELIEEKIDTSGWSGRHVLTGLLGTREEYWRHCLPISE